ncbi:hypothetical protein ACFW9D_11705 [Streptomyces sp. NPDC059524]|uniref:effector-associated constant component EACC1 n=1 Tax=Streptomyces sp. NPDC059524 TaxID=3346856 RepID=UPI0036CBD34E
MEVVVSIKGGQGDELGLLERTLKQQLAPQGIRVVRTVSPAPQGALGATDVLQFLGENVALPVLVQEVSAYVKQRFWPARGRQVECELIRTDLPDGTRRTQLIVKGEPKDAAATLKELQ